MFLGGGSAAIKALQLKRNILKPGDVVWQVYLGHGGHLCWARNVWAIGRGMEHS
jgi:hypothetical protein